MKFADTSPSMLLAESKSAELSGSCYLGFLKLVLDGSENVSIFYSPFFLSIFFLVCIFLPPVLFFLCFLFYLMAYYPVSTLCVCILVAGRSGLDHRWCHRFREGVGAALAVTSSTEEEKTV